MRLFIRTEASSAIGMGHFMRCFAIAEAAQAKGIEVTFLLNEIGETIAARLHSIGAKGLAIDGGLGSVADFMAFPALGMSRRDWLVIDSYQATEDYIRAQNRAARVAVVDDLCALEAYDCDLIINAAMAASDMPYGRKSGAKLLLGADYALIREEFHPHRRPAEPGSFVSIMFGGSDPTALTEACAKILHEALPASRIRLIAGPANRHTESLTAFAQKLERVEVFVSPESVAQVLSGSDLVITAAGGSVGEVAAMGLPGLVLVVYDNQAAALKACPYPVIDARTGLPADLGDRVKALMDDPARRADIAIKAHSIVDGKGPQRIVEAMFGV